MFFNAAVQGNTRTWDTLSGKNGKYIIAGGLSLGILQAIALGSMDDEDEDRSELIPDWVKRTSWIIPYGEGKTDYVAIPMPLGLHVIPNISRMLTETAIEADKGESVSIPSKTLELMALLVDGVNPMGGSEAGFTQMVTPSILKPLVQLDQNRSGLGGPIYRERHANDAGAPGYKLGRDNTNPAYKLAAEGIHRAFHGNDPDIRDPSAPAWTSPQPEALRYLPEAYFGGVWRETEKFIDTASAIAQGKELDRRRTILLSRFSGDLTDPSAPMTPYYQALDQVSAAYRARKLADEAGIDRDLPLADLYKEAGRVRRQMRTLLDERRELALVGGEDATIREIEREMADIMREFTREVRDVRRAK
jgi:hypothetical protein